MRFASIGLWKIFDSFLMATALPVSLLVPFATTPYTPLPMICVSS